MSEQKTKPTKLPFEEFIAQQPEARRQDCRTLDALMRKVTGEDAVMWGNIVGYGRYAYTRSNGTPCEWPVAGFSPRKQTLSVYVMAGFEPFAHQLAQLGKHGTGQSCLYIKRLSDINIAALETIIEGSVRAMASQRVRG